MKNNTDWKLFFKLLFVCVIVTLMVLPYNLALAPTIAKMMTPIILVAQVVQATVIFAISIFFGLKLSKKTGFGMPVLEGKKPLGYLKEILKPSVAMGILGGLYIILLSFPFGSVSIEFLKAEMSVAIWKRLFASFYGGITEEIIFRFFLMTLFVWITMKIRKNKKGMPTDFGVWISIIISSVIFGLGHLGITGSMTAITSMIVFRAVLLNGVSVIFSWLYWKKGLESAIIAHFTSDIVIHVITPIVASFFI